VGDLGTLLNLGRAASGGASSPHPSCATRSQPESIRIRATIIFLSKSDCFGQIKLTSSPGREAKQRFSGFTPTKQQKTILFFCLFVGVNPTRQLVVNLSLHVEWFWSAAVVYLW